nr:hypothetical protein GCM10010200_015440 [Actinomadura rugatobispora]
MGVGMAHELVEVDADRVDLAAGIPQVGMHRGERSVQGPLLPDRSADRPYHEGTTSEPDLCRGLMDLFVLLVADTDSQFPFSPSPFTELRPTLQRL